MILVDRLRAPEGIRAGSAARVGAFRSAMLIPQADARAARSREITSSEDLGSLEMARSGPNLVPLVQRDVRFRVGWNSMRHSPPRYAAGLVLRCCRRAWLTLGLWSLAAAALTSREPRLQ